jgi:hypothetical protein
MLYILVGIVWGIFSVKMQQKFHPTCSDKRDLAINFIVNGVIWPISMVVAAYRYFTKTGWAKNL